MANWWFLETGLIFVGGKFFCWEAIFLRLGLLKILWAIRIFGWRLVNNGFRLLMWFMKS